MPDLNTRLAASTANLDPGTAQRVTAAIRQLDRVGIHASRGSAPSMAEMEAALTKAGVTDPIQRIAHKRAAERVASGLPV